ncbi:MAG: ferritin-like domain-containing protein [Polyangiaceae bacterium]
MLRVVDAIKETWHDDLVAHPETHAWVLSLYRAGELHPELVSDYFPAWAADDPALAQQIEAHARDEAKHVRLYDSAIARLGVPRTDFDGLDVFNVAIRRETPVGFDVREADTDATSRRERLAHFLAHAHFLERRVVRSLDYHLAACARAGRREVERVVEHVAADEERHVAYTLAAVRELLPRQAALDVLATHERAEARANLAFSARQVRGFLRKFGGLVGRRHALVYRVSASMMEVARARLV